MGRNTAGGRDGALRSVELAEALWRACSQGEESLARHAKVTRDVTAAKDKTAAAMGRLARQLPHHAQRLQALAAAVENACGSRGRAEAGPGSVTIVEPDSGTARSIGAERLQATRQESEALVRRFDEAQARWRATIEQVSQGRPQPKVLRDSAFARLRARPESLPVIEQAKGIIMAQQGCGPEEAFDLLCRASQRSNVKVHVLAAQIVGHIAANTTSTKVTPLPLGATRNLRQGTRARPRTG